MSTLWYRTDVTLKVRGGYGEVHCIHIYMYPVQDGRGGGGWYMN